MRIRDTKNVTACVVDYGNFVSLADKLGETYKKVYYYTPFEQEYYTIDRCVIGEGSPHVERLFEPLSPKYLDRIDLFVFPDMGFSGLQKHLETLGKAVWGSRDVTEIELYRSVFPDVLKKLGLPVPKSKVLYGLKQLDSFLKDVEDVWVKIDIFRDDMETWHHIDYEHSLPMLRYLTTKFGGVSEQVVFVAVQPIPDAQEQGYDGYCVDGQFPDISFQGYEKKNELYLGAHLPMEEMPPMVQEVNRAMIPMLAEEHYRNFFATEIRNEFFIDPTPRMAGQTQEHLLESCPNLAEIIWAGANGILVQPIFIVDIAASATLHYKEVPGEHWKAVEIPSKVERWFKLANYSRMGNTYHFPPGHNDEVGVVIGLGDTVEEAIEEIKSHLEEIKNEPLTAEVEEFAELIKDIKKVEARGEKFSNSPLPDPAIAVR